ncbi:adenylate/guanylate cyclase domain-containing protein [Kaustia mangrovi]|uniref:Adenylate/guanylate cyclase domain-containing protein n=1 Tax=Kaustia mangrovi TaxID=2593653 RepID=A0A7S8C0Z0_9HYPH|nr:adenylate/guanylate cyclase domain-containing protein [Kaustia mangrovi]QPC41375.1 adenylate/guanylate cyclase domain-containing protein [Kaustia mangrovi]
MEISEVDVQTAESTPSPILIGQLADWLMEQALRDGNLKEIISGCCERLQSAGVGLYRCFLGFSMLHPLYRAVGFTWVRGEGLTVETFPHVAEGLPDDFKQSPFHYMLEHDVPCLRRHLDADSGKEFAVLGEIHEAGGTDYVAFAVGFHHTDENQGMLGSWTSDRPTGFSEGELRALIRIRDRLGVACKMAIRSKLAQNILVTYLGADAGSRVLSGQIKRGDGETIQAAIWYADLRNSTRMADTMSRQDFIDTLNSYFETIGAAVTAERGEILSFVGDAMLAIFPADANDGGMEKACERAYAAALDARRRLAGSTHCARIWVCRRWTA